MGPIGCPETSVSKYQSTLSNIAEARRFTLHYDESLKLLSGISSCSEINGNLIRWSSSIMYKVMCNQKRLESSEMWCWRRMEKIIWTDHVRNDEVLIRVKEQRNILHEISKGNLIFVVPCIMLYSGEISPTRCNNCVFYSQWLYSTCFG